MIKAIFRGTWLYNLKILLRHNFLTHALKQKQYLFSVSTRNTHQIFTTKYSTHIKTATSSIKTFSRFTITPPNTHHTSSGRKNKQNKIYDCKPILTPQKVQPFVSYLTCKAVNKCKLLEALSCIPLLIPSLLSD